MLLNTAYFPPVEYFAAIADGTTLSEGRVVPCELWIEAKENYQKQSYRNRCRIYTGSGVQDLNVPVIHRNGTYQLPISEIEIDYSTPWVIRSQRAIASAYWSSPFFEYYKDDIFAIMDSHPKTLLELNTILLRHFLDKIGIPANIRFTEEFTLRSRQDTGSESPQDKYGNDFREIIHPKRENTILSELGLEKPYYQVFSGKYGFIPNLSIMDLLFNEGPDSISYLKTSIQRYR